MIEQLTLPAFASASRNIFLFAFFKWFGKPPHGIFHVAAFLLVSSLAGELVWQLAAAPQMLKIHESVVEFIETQFISQAETTLFCTETVDTGDNEQFQLWNELLRLQTFSLSRSHMTRSTTCRVEKGSIGKLRFHLPTEQNPNETSFRRNSETLPLTSKTKLFSLPSDDATASSISSRFKSRVFFLAQKLFCCFCF